MRYFLFTILIATQIFAIQTSDRLFDCTEIFKERKSELLVELERIDEQKQALNALKTATEELLKKKEVKITQKEEVVEKNLATITQKEESIKTMLSKNEAILKEIKEIKINKIAQTFSKMKAASSANILSDMQAQKAVEIMQSLKPKVVGQILTKMDAKKASELTILLSK